MGPGLPRPPASRQLICRLARKCRLLTLAVSAPLFGRCHCPMPWGDELRWCGGLGGRRLPSSLGKPPTADQQQLATPSNFWKQCRSTSHAASRAGPHLPAAGKSRCADEVGEGHPNSFAQPLDVVAVRGLAADPDEAGVAEETPVPAGWHPPQTVATAPRPSPLVSPPGFID